MHKLKLIILLVLISGACGSERTAENKPSNTAQSVTLANTDTHNANVEQANVSATNTNSVPPTRAQCQAIETGDDAVQQTQTYVIDFEPFKNSCFVTTYNADTDPPMEAKTAIYRDGKKVFDLPGQFNGSTMGCSVEAVAFGDLNNDGKKDIVVAGKCISNTGPYNENVVYVNNGSTFTTDEGSNSVLVDYDNVKNIIEFVKKNPKIFFK